MCEQLLSVWENVQQHWKEAPKLNERQGLRQTLSKALLILTSRNRPVFISWIHNTADSKHDMFTAKEQQRKRTKTQLPAHAFISSSCIDNLQGSKLNHSLYNFALFWLEIYTPATLGTFKRDRSGSITIECERGVTFDSPRTHGKRVWGLYNAFEWTSAL